MVATSIQNSLAAGELSPSLLGRTDVKKFGMGTFTCRNFFASYRGGVSSRAGLAYVGTCKQPGTSAPPRDIPFQFSLTQGYVLEFGDDYMRIKSDGAYVTEATKSAAVDTDAVFTVASHGYSVGNWVYDLGNEDFSGLTWIIASVPTVNTFTVTDLFGNAVLHSASSSGGTVARIYTVVAPYDAIDLPYLKYTQSADVMTLTLVNTETSTEYPPYNLARLGNTNWVFTAQTFTAAITAPTGLTGKAFSSSVKTTYYSYVITAVSADTGEESVASSPVYVQNNDIAIYAGSNSIAWNSVTGASSYNVYAATAAYSTTIPVSSLYGFVGTSLGPSFTDTNITPDFTVVPPVHNDPFAIGAITDVIPTVPGNNYSQSTIGWSVTTSTGTGFNGFPVVANGDLLGFVITNHGKNYAVGNTIAFTDSGGGVAIGNFSSASNSSDGASVIINGVAIKFRRSSAAPGYNETPLGNTLALTMESLANFCNASTDISLVCATYTYDATHLYITYKTPGSVGNAFTLDADTSGFTRSGANLTGGGTAGTGATATLSIGPTSGTYPGVAAYFQQRRVYAASLNEPDTYWMSQPGLFNNMDSSIPVTDADSITGTPWAQQVNGTQFLVPMPGGLIVFNGRGVWQVSGGANAAITPSNQTAVPQAYNGSVATVPPIPINEDILYIQSKGYMVRDLAYNFYNNIYTGTDLTVLSDHLFNNYQIVQWAWAQEPYKLIWVVRNDGILLCLTYLKEQEIFSWTRHDSNGLFQGVCSVTEPPVDAVYFIVKRYVQGGWRYYSERMDDRNWSSAEDSFCVDSGLRSSLTYPDATLTSSGITGTVTMTASSGVFTADNEGDVIRIGGGKATITDYTSSTVVGAEITEDITDVITDDPEFMPVPALSGEWSTSTPTTTISGLNHLEGLEVSILADGSVVPNQTVADGEIELEVEASNVVVGLPYICQVQSTYLEAPAPGGTMQNKRKNITSVGVRLQGTRGLFIGADQPDQSFQQNNVGIPWTGLSEIKERTPVDLMGVAIPLYTGDYFKNINSQWAVEGQVALQQTYPLPANILALISYWELGD